MKRRYLKSDRLLRRSEYKEIFKKGSHFVGKYVVLEYLFKGSRTPKLGVTVTKKFGKAHDRNRFKRLSREAFRLLKGDLSNNLSLNLRPRLYARGAKMQDIMDEIRTLSQKCHESVPTKAADTDRCKSSK